MSSNKFRLGFMVIALGVCVGIFFMPPGVDATAKASNAETESDAKAEEEVDYKTLENPILFTKKSIGRGRMIFKRMCVECHGPDGKGQMDVIADASDLTVPKRYYNGTAVGEVYASIRDGAGESMPAFLEQLQQEDDLWHLVNFVQSLWPEKLRPQLVEEEKNEDVGEAGKGESPVAGGGTNDGRKD